MGRTMNSRVSTEQWKQTWERQAKNIKWFRERGLRIDNELETCQCMAIANMNYVIGEAIEKVSATRRNDD
jgi:hypothetical protein